MIVATNFTQDCFDKTKKESVIVTGSSGYIGSELVGQLRINKIDYMGIDKLNSDSERELCFNICDRDLTIQTIKKYSPDYLIHCGTHSALAYQNNFLESFKEDAVALVNILEALSELPNTRLIFFSSSYVYSGLVPNKTFQEDALLKPSHNFGAAKSFFEQLVLRTHPNCVVFRASSVFGPGKCLHPNAVESMARECLAHNQVTIWGAGTRKMQYVYIEDVIRHTIQAFSLKSGIYNLGGNEHTSVGGAARMIAECFGSEAVFLKDKKEAETLPFMDNAKLKRASQKAQFAPLAASLKQYLECLIKETRQLCKDAI